LVKRGRQLLAATPTISGSRMVTPFARGGRRDLRAHRWHAAVVCKDVVANSAGSARRLELGDREQRAACSAEVDGAHWPAFDGGTARQAAPPTPCPLFGWPACAPFLIGAPSSPLLKLTSHYRSDPDQGQGQGQSYTSETAGHCALFPCRAGPGYPDPVPQAPSSSLAWRFHEMYCAML
jgi:hypothetical protein